MNGKQTIIRGYYALPAMIERNIVIDLFGSWSGRFMYESAKLVSPVRLREGPQE